MKKFLAVAALAAFAGTASATDLALWTFESSVPVSAGPFTAEAGVNAGSSNAVSNNLDGTFSNPVGNGSFESWSSTTWAIGDYYEFATSTTGYNSIILSFDHTSSGTGPRDFSVLFSTDGVNFNPAGSYSVLANSAPNAWSSAGARNALHTYSFNIAADNAALVTIRLQQNSVISANGGTVASGGTSRVDNVLIEGTIPTPGTMGLLGLAGVAAIRRRRA